MIATDRRMPIHDFFLVALSVAVIVVSTWPEAPPRQWVQFRQPDGNLQPFSLPQDDPRLAKLRLRLETWAKAGQETRFAVAQWRAEVAEFYASRTEPPAAPANATFRAVSFRGGVEADPPWAAEEQARNGGVAAAIEQQLRQQQHDDWLLAAAAARAEVARIEEIRRSRRALEVPPPIVFGPLQPGGTPARAYLVAPLAGLLVGLGFTLWAFLFPSLRLAPSPSDDGGQEISGGKANASGREPPHETGLPVPSHVEPELQLRVPSNWLRVHQPAAVLARMGAAWLLAVVAATTIVF